MSRIYRSGKAVIKKPAVDRYTKGYFLRRFACNLRWESIDCGCKLNALFHADEVPKNLIQPVADFYVHILNITELSRFVKGRVSKRLQTEVMAFIDAIDQMDFTISAASSHTDCYKKTKEQVIQVCDACRHFIWQFEQTMNSFKLGFKLPVAPTNWALKEHLDQLIRDHRATQGAVKALRTQQRLVLSVCITIPTQSLTLSVSFTHLLLVMS
jgi:hypothetical protein